MSTRSSAFTLNKVEINIHVQTANHLVCETIQHGIGLRLLEYRCFITPRRPTYYFPFPRFTIRNPAILSTSLSSVQIQGSNPRKQMHHTLTLKCIAKPEQVLLQCTNSKQAQGELSRIWVHIVSRRHYHAVSCLLFVFFRYPGLLIVF
jgi:hypothetical protein